MLKWALNHNPGLSYTFAPTSAQWWWSSKTANESWTPSLWWYPFHVTSVPQRDCWIDSRPSSDQGWSSLILELSVIRHWICILHSLIDSDLEIWGVSYTPESDSLRVHITSDSFHPYNIDWLWYGNASNDDSHLSTRWYGITNVALNLISTSQHQVYLEESFFIYLF